MIENLIQALNDDTVKAAFEEWLKSRPAFYVSAPKPTPPQVIGSPDAWTVTSTSTVAHTHALAWTGTMPVTPDGSQSDYLIAELRLTIRRPAVEP